MPSDSHTNTVNLRPICRSTRNTARAAISLRIADSVQHRTSARTYSFLLVGSTL